MNALQAIHPHPKSHCLKRLLPALLGALLLQTLAPGARALDLVPDLFKKPKINATIWQLNEQFVRIVPIEAGAPPNSHPVTLDPRQVEEALESLQLWKKGGVFRDEESQPVYPKSEAMMIAKYVTQALAKASPGRTSRSTCGPTRP